MAYADALDMLAYWAEWPPVHEAVRFIAVGLGIQKMPSQRRAAAAVGSPDDGIAAMMAAYPDGVVRA